MSPRSFAWALRAVPPPPPFRKRGKRDPLAAEIAALGWEDIALSLLGYALSPILPDGHGLTPIEKCRIRAALAALLTGEAQKRGEQKTSEREALRSHGFAEEARRLAHEDSDLDFAHVRRAFEHAVTAAWLSMGGDCAPVVEPGLVRTR